MISCTKVKSLNEVDNDGILETFQQLMHELEEIEHSLWEKSEDLKLEIPSSNNNIAQEDLGPDCSLPSTILDRVHQALRRYTEIHKTILEQNKSLHEELEYIQLNFTEIQMERDVLLTKVHSYLEENSSLKCRLEEQRCQRVSNQRKSNEDSEARIKELELDNKKLYDGIIEKGKEVLDLNITLEETRKLLKIKEVEVSSLKMDKSKTVAALEEDLEKVRAEKTKLEEENKKLLEFICSREVGKRRRMRREKKTLRRSKSVEDVNFIFCQNGSPDFFLPTRCSLSINDERNLQFPILNSSSGNEPPLKRDSSFSSKQSKFELKERKHSSNTEHTLKSCLSEGNKYEKTDVEYPESALNSQLNALRYGLVNVTKKLKVLKSQLVDPESTKENAVENEKRSRNLKRKADSLENPKTVETVKEEAKSDGKNVRDVLEDAKNLNAKLQSLRKEKEKAIVSNKKENVGVRMRGKYDNCQTIEKDEEEDDVDDDSDDGNVGVSTPPIFRYFKSTIIKLKKVVSDCEKKLDEGLLSKDAAFANLVSAFSVCIMSNLRYFHESEKRALNSLKDEIDTKSLMDEESNKSREESSEEKENGGGDNLLKMEIAPDGREEYKELKIQIARLKFEIEQFPIFRE